MHTKRKLIVGNWKLNGSLADNQQKLNCIKNKLSHITHIDIGICVSYPYLFQAQQILKGSHVMWGSQNVSQFNHGAYTACVSANMIAEFGATLSILGHSERRYYSNENSHKAVLRIIQAANAGITPIYCIGESLHEHQTGQAKKVIKTQLQPLFNLDTKTIATIKNVQIVIAYEPVWAIGTNQAATPEYAQEIHAYIRDLVAKHDASFALELRIIYGGSLNPNNAEQLFKMPDIDGGLVGRASLDVESFIEICKAC